MTPPSEKLKPCPFCGREVKLDFISNDGERAAWMVHCSNDGSHSATCASRSKDAAIADWNARVPQVPEASQDEVEGLARLFGNDVEIGIMKKTKLPVDQELKERTRRLREIGERAFIAGFRASERLHTEGK